jgi:hypothetical protein
MDMLSVSHNVLRECSAQSSPQRMQPKHHYDPSLDLPSILPYGSYWIEFKLIILGQKG